jgi:hypothetical protein
MGFKRSTVQVCPPRPNPKSRMRGQGQERRRAIRIKKQLIAQYKDKAAISKWNVSTIENFSELGMLIITQEYFPVNTILNFRLRLPSSPFEWLEPEGRVVACERKEVLDYIQFDAVGYHTRIEFIDMEHEERESIRKYINWFLSRGG